jgi:hypothetical protein
LESARLQCPVGVQKRETSIGVGLRSRSTTNGEIPDCWRASGIPWLWPASRDRHRWPEAFTADDALADRFSDLGVISDVRPSLGWSLVSPASASAHSINERARSREVLVSGAAYPLRCARAFARATLSLICSPGPNRSNRQNRTQRFGSTTVALGHVWTAPWQELSDVSAALVGCGHVSGLLMRRGRPLALMLCADRVPIVYPHSEVR